MPSTCILGQHTGPQCPANALGVFLQAIVFLSINALCAPGDGQRSLLEVRRAEHTILTRMSCLQNKDEIIEMALSDKVPFDTIKTLYGLDENQVKRLMQAALKPGSYRAWRKRVEKFSRQRSTYK